MSEVSLVYPEGDEPKPLVRTRSLGLKRQGTTTPGFTAKNAVIYDPGRQKLLKDWVNQVEADNHYTKVPLKGRNCSVDVNIEVGPEKTKVFLANVDLARLGSSVFWQRKAGNINCIYVLGQVRDGWKGDAMAAKF